MSGMAHYYQETVNYMCTDAHGNVYAVSQVGYTGIVADTFLMGSVINSGNMLVTSYTCDGQMRWAKLIHSSGGDCIAYGIAADGLGHIYVAGYLENLAGHLYIGYDTTTPTATYQAEGLIQLDTLGHFNWLRYVGDNTISTDVGSYSFGSILATDAANNAHFFLYTKHGVHITPSLTSVGGTYDLVYNTAGTILSETRLDLDSAWYLNSAVIDPVTNKLYVSGEINITGIYGGFLTDSFYAAAFQCKQEFAVAALTADMVMTMDLLEL